MCGCTKAGARARSPAFQGNGYSIQVTPSAEPSTTISGRSVVITRNRP